MDGKQQTIRKYPALGAIGISNKGQKAKASITEQRSKSTVFVTVLEKMQEPCQIMFITIST